MKNTFNSPVRPRNTYNKQSTAAKRGFSISANKVKKPVSSFVSQPSKTQQIDQENLSPKWDLVREKYDILEIIGQGSHGQVVKAIHKKTRKMVAIKMVGRVFDANYITKKVLREISIMRQLTQMHCNDSVCRILDVVAPKTFDIKENNYLFIVMEYMKTDLKRVIDSLKTTNFDEKDLLRILYNTLCGLNFIHNADVLHRDIKPSNILIDENFNVKICDFGLSRTDPNPLVPTITPSTRENKFKKAQELYFGMDQRTKKTRNLSNHVVTRSYRPPEIIVQEKEYHFQVDLWSIGCILSELISSTKVYRDAGINYSRILFKGTSCFPLSPCTKQRDSNGRGQTVIEDSDQLKVILKILGNQSEEDVCFLSDMKSVNYVEKNLQDLPKIDFKKEFPMTHSEIIGILQNMLEFNPYFRKSAGELIKHPIFNMVRDQKLENEPTGKVSLDIDRAEAFDYKLGDILYNMDDLMKMVTDEVALIQSLKSL